MRESEDEAMSLLKRHIGRRVAGVGVGVALLVLGLEGPAFAAAPTITSFTPTSGPTNCVVDITGTAFTDFPVTPSYTVGFKTGATVTAATDFLVVSATEIWAVVPGLTPGTSYTIEISNSGGTADSTTTFLSTTGAGGCAPTVASFAPTCGSAGTTVVVTGTNLLMDLAGPAGSIDGGTVAFSPYTSNATHTVPDVDTATSLSVLVSSDAADGPIRVTTFGAATGGQVFSTASFQVPPPDCPAAGPITHARSITLKLKGSLTAKGKVSLSDSTDTFTDCIASVPVKIQRLVSGHWKTVGKTTTSDTGAYSKKIKNKPGKYRSKAVPVAFADTSGTITDICTGAKSRAVKH